MAARKRLPDTVFEGPFVICHDLAEARRAVARARALHLPVRMLSAPGAASAIGPRVFKEIVSQALAGIPDTGDIRAYIDCTDNPGFALKALDEGCNVRIDADEAMLMKLREIAGSTLSVITENAGSALDLSDASDEELDQWLQQSIH